jgi:hypothetical protein
LHTTIIGINEAEAEELGAEDCYQIVKRHHHSVQLKAK